jgi:hypothetical protein
MLVQRYPQDAPSGYVTSEVLNLGAYALVAYVAAWFWTLLVLAVWRGFRWIWRAVAGTH